MTKTIKTYWNLLEQYCKMTNKEECYPIIQDEHFEDYKRAVKDAYDAYKKDYMQSGVEFLDRHKMAAILVVEGIKSKIMIPSEPSNVKNDEIFIGCEKILLLAAIDYLVAHMNRIFRKYDLKEIDFFEYPSAFTCETKFIDVLSRTLFFAHTKYTLNIMELSEKFFLLEYITILRTFGKDSDKYFKALKESSDDIDSCQE